MVYRREPHFGYLMASLSQAIEIEWVAFSFLACMDELFSSSMLLNTLAVQGDLGDRDRYGSRV